VQERWPVTTLTGESGAVTDGTGRSVGLRRLLVAGVVVVVVVLADQLTKWWAVDRLSSGPIHLIGTLDLELSYNTGSAFSLFQRETPVLVVVAAVLVVALAALVWRSPTLGRAAILGLIIGGALGNLSDRLFRANHGAVVDFVALHFWPTFNVADSSIVIGCVLLVVSLLRTPSAS
jgi:signal peptidase II